MISILTAFPPTERQLDGFHPGRPVIGTTSRLDVQRRHLEHKKMNYGQAIHELTVRDRANDIEQRLERRRMIAESRLARTSVSARIRQSLGQALISAGERVRPESV